MKLQFFCSALSLKKTLWAGLLLLLLTACNSGTKAASGEDISSETTGSVFMGDANDDDLVTDGISDANDTTAISATLQALILSLDKTTLNKDENTTVKVTARYEDGTSKDVTDKVEWIVNPKGSVFVMQKILTAKKDNATTIKAKLGDVLSDEINLNITWTVHGYTLPPEPDKTVNDSTLLGIDVNGNGVRDDVERWIYDRYKDEHPIYIDIAMQAGRGYRLVVETPDRAKEIRLRVKGALFCAWYYKNDADRYGDPILVHERIDVLVKKQYFNTKERQNVYWQYDKLLSGGVYDLPRSKQRKGLCDFNTSKYGE